jgi:enhancing lycopene biosynthesis protein 2
MGVRHVPCAVEETCVDREHQVVSTPAYMLAGRISEAAAGIEKLVSEVLDLVAARA